MGIELGGGGIECRLSKGCWKRDPSSGVRVSIGRLLLYHLTKTFRDAVNDMGWWLSKKAPAEQ